MCIYTVYYHSVPITKEDLYARRIALFNQCESEDLGVSPSAIKAALAMKCLLDEEAADDPISLIRDICINDIH
mgnify:CR=1 FL=1